MLIHRYLQYLPQATLLAGVKSGIFHQGYFNANPYNYLEVSVYLTVLPVTANSDLRSFQGNVNAQAFGKPILLVGRESMNRAIDGDVVVVEMLPEAEWKAPGQEVLDQDGAVAEAILSRAHANIGNRSSRGPQERRCR
jgi:exosome complex exonuclease DIS3/RRP44